MRKTCFAESSTSAFLAESLTRGKEKHCKWSPATDQKWHPIAELWQRLGSGYCPSATHVLTPEPRSQKSSPLPRQESNTCWLERWVYKETLLKITTLKTRRPPASHPCLPTCCLCHLSSLIPFWGTYMGCAHLCDSYHVSLALVCKHKVRSGAASARW